MKKKIGTINIDPRSWIIERRGDQYFGVECGPRSKAAFLTGDHMAVYFDVTHGFNKPSDASHALTIFLKGKKL